MTAIIPPQQRHCYSHGSATVELENQMVQRELTANIVQTSVEVDNVARRNDQWRRLHDIPDFRINLAPSYVKDKVVRDNHEDFQLDEHTVERGFLTVWIFSMYQKSTKHQIFIAYNNVNEAGANDVDDDIIALVTRR